MTVRFDEWRRLLAGVNPQNPDHAYLYETKDSEGVKLVVRTRREYEQNQQAYRKLSLSEIVDLTNQATFTEKASDAELPLKDRARWYIKSQVMVDMHLQNVAEVNVKEKMAGKLHTAASLVEDIRSAAVILSKMREQAEQKRSDEAVKGIWGKIKWYIWSWFCDPIRQIREVASAAFKPVYVYECAQEAIKTRIYFNMIYFEEKAQLPERSAVSVEDMTKKFPSPADVKKGWYVKFAPDKFPRVSPQANAYRTRVKDMVEIWESINELVKKNSDTFPTNFQEIFRNKTLQVES